MEHSNIKLEELPEAQRRQMETMLADKFICNLLGIKLTSVGEGTATAELEVKDIHMNGVGICQGGVLFSLADYTLAAAFNHSVEPVVALEVSISYVKSVKGGKVIAEARELCRTRTTTAGEVTVRDEQGRILCLAKGRGYILQPH
ncbi:MAG: PaaI family thioesterase [Planctomycetia bacterium]|nr:PaaI family thioesterase [Planctomycetia bacterium]